MECVRGLDWIDLISGRNRRQALVNAVRDFRVSKIRTIS